MSGATLIEFVGIPGSGKSTLARRLVGRLGMAGANVRLCNPEMSESRIRNTMLRTAAAMTFAAKHPILGARATAMMLQSRQPSVDDYRAALVNWLCKCKTMVSLAAGPVHVSDEGVLHAVWSAAYRARMRGQLAEAAAWAIARMRPSHWIVVLINVDGQDAVERALRRQGRPNRLARDAKVDRAAAQANAEDAMRVVADTLAYAKRQKTNGRLSVVSVDNESTIDVDNTVVSLQKDVARAMEWGKDRGC